MVSGVKEPFQSRLLSSRWSCGAWAPWTEIPCHPGREFGATVPAQRLPHSAFLKPARPALMAHSPVGGRPCLFTKTPGMVVLFLNLTEPSQTVPSYLQDHGQASDHGADRTGAKGRRTSFYLGLGKFC